MTLPTLPLIGVVVACCAVAAGIWAAGATMLGHDDAIIAGAIGAALVASCASLGVVVMFPWIARPASTAMLLWLFTDMLGMAAALVLAFLLYSATFLSAVPLLLGVVLAYLLTLLGKAAVVALHVKRTLP
jgi:hypothetical protein